MQTFRLGGEVLQVALRLLLHLRTPTTNRRAELEAERPSQQTPARYHPPPGMSKRELRHTVDGTVAAL